MANKRKYSVAQVIQILTETSKIADLGEESRATNESGIYQLKTAGRPTW